MKYTSLEDCINDLKKTNQLKIITKQVDPDLEIASIHLEEYKKSGKALLFTNKISNYIQYLQDNINNSNDLLQVSPQNITKTISYISHQDL